VLSLSRGYRHTCTGAGGAQGAHGLRRTNEDKRRSVMTLLNDPEWAVWSDRAIARQCAVETGRDRLLTINR
jgi:hypothetical protein